MQGELYHVPFFLVCVCVEVHPFSVICGIYLRRLTFMRMLEIMQLFYIQIFDIRLRNCTARDEIISTIIGFLSTLVVRNDMHRLRDMMIASHIMYSSCTCTVIIYSFFVPHDLSCQSLTLHFFYCWTRVCSLIFRKRLLTTKLLLFCKRQWANCRRKYIFGHHGTIG